MNAGQREGHEHSLSELLAGPHLSTEERVREAASRAPFWVTAIAAHAILAFVLGMVYFHQDRKAVVDEGPVFAQANEVDRTVIDEKAAEEPKEIERAAIPQTPDAGPTDPEEYFQPPDLVVTEHGNNRDQLGAAEGDDKTHDNPLTMSFDGWGKASPIGVGLNGGHAGGGIGRGSLMGGRRSAVSGRNQTADLAPKVHVVLDALEWLRRHQSPDGSWDCDGFSANCDAKLGEACGGRGQAVFDAGVTGLAVLAFLGAGYDGGRESPYDVAARNGLKWLRGVQDAQGCFGPSGDTRHTYSHAIATIAMCEAANSTGLRQWKACAQRAIDYIAACQNPYKAWRYGPRPGDNDVSVTGWMLMAIKSAKEAGLSVNTRMMDDGIAFMDSMTDEDTGRTGYTKKGEPPVRPEGQQVRFPSAESESLTAVALCSRIFTGKAEGSPLMKAGAELLSKKLPVWDEARGSVDMYYWYYGTLAMFQLGGDNWARWNKNLAAVVTDHQIKTGCQKGSWDPKDPWGEDGGRVYSTSLMALCYEVYWRYPKVFGAKADVAKK